MAHPRLDVHVDPAMPGRPNVIVRICGGTGDAPGLLLNGHIDARLRREWLDAATRSTHGRQDGELLYGGAISDMLRRRRLDDGGDARGGRTLPPLPGDLVFLANMYHDSNGLGTKYALASEDGWPQYGINGEPTSMSASSPCMAAA